MKAVRAAEGGVRLVDLDEPPGTGEILQVRSASICSSDLIYISQGSRHILGHELAGVRADGSAYIVEALFGCMECEQCLNGNYNRCPTHGERALGFSADGGMAEQFRVPTARLVPLPAGLDVRDASIVEPASVSWHGVRISGAAPGARVAVVGAGALGLLAVAAARRQGITDIAIEARYPHQIEAAERLGASGPPKGEYDVIIEAAGSPASLARAVELLAPGGTVVAIGVYMGTIEVDWLSVFLREGRLLSSLGYCRHGGGREMDDAAAMLAEEPDIARALITHRFPLEEAEEAFRVASDRKSGAIRVVLEP
ncbi:zinc-dependent alcohol dehydrogenase [Parafrankia discariae]|uniref:zinc-dependent alcohol dehydrogenase n=1 Tax=Parafrankia discariae TaxID=365528 RepID=UPI0003AA456B|nr:alcohol dehydrogenase catalytic domain-containing protein [Parafrankia discariae]